MPDLTVLAIAVLLIAVGLGRLYRRKLAREAKAFESTNELMRRILR